MAWCSPAASYPYPDKSSDVHFEIEMVVALGRGGKDIPVESSLDHVFGYAVGLDMTRRDLQGEAKKMGRPWEVGKAFDYSAPCTEVVPAADIGHPSQGAIRLVVNDETRQEGDLAQMIWKVPEIISYLSGLFTPSSTRERPPASAQSSVAISSPARWTGSGS